MVWCGFTYSFLVRKRGIHQCFPSPASKSGGDAVYSLSFPTCTHMLQWWEHLTRRIWQCASLNLRQTLLVRIVWQCFLGSNGSGDTGSPRDAEAESQLYPCLAVTQGFNEWTYPPSLWRGTGVGGWLLVIVQHSALVHCLLNQQVGVLAGRKTFCGLYPK